MEGFDTKLIGLIWNLLPGFLAAWIFHGLTAHPKATPFERIAQALIFTALCKFLLPIIRWLSLAIGRLAWIQPIAIPWGEESEFASQILSACAMGLLFAYLANTGKAHRILRDWNITKNTSRPSQWYAAFHDFNLWVYLYLKDGKTLFGWPYEFPDHPDKDQFFLEDPHWVEEINGVTEHKPIPNVKYMLVQASEVRFVQFYAPPHSGQPQEEPSDGIAREQGALSANGGESQVRPERTLPNSAAPGISTSTDRPRASRHERKKRK